MTSQKDQIQSLIAEIDTVLQKTSPRLPWVMSGEATQQRQVLERVRNYLVAFQTHQPTEGAVGSADARPDLLAHDIYYRAQSATPLEATVGSEQPEELTPQQMLQAVMQEMSYLRTSLMQPLRHDLDVLRQQREALTQEIQQLEAQRRNYELSQSPVNQQQLVGDFLQILMGRLQESLAQQVAQTLEHLQHQALPATSSPMLAGMPEPATTLTPQLEQLQALQARSDQLLVGLDSSLRVVFESLQQSIQAYQESLTQGVDRLHTLGQQGEVMVNALLNHLAQRLGQEASSYLQSSAQQFAGLETGQASIDSLLAFPEAASKVTAPRSDSSAPPFPYPGIELPPPAESPTAPTPVDTAIESWLQSVSTVNQPDTLELGDSGLAALDLSQLELGQVDANNLEAFLSLDLNLTDPNASVEPELFSADTLANLSESPSSLEGSTDQLPELGGVTEEDTEDIDAALKLLEQLSQELQDQTQAVTIADAEATLDRIIAPSPVSPAATEPPPNISEDARDELDEFYESFFGAESFGSPPPEPEPPVTEPAAIGDQDWDLEAGNIGATNFELELPEFGTADETLALTELEADTSLGFGEGLSELAVSPEPEASLEDMLFGPVAEEASAIDLPALDNATDLPLPESSLVDTTSPEPTSETWLPEPNFLDSFFDEQDAISRSESVAALEVDLEPPDLATFEGESAIPEQIGSLTELAALFPEPPQPVAPEAPPEKSSGDRVPTAPDLSARPALDLEISISADQGLVASESQSGTNTIPGSDDLYILAAPEEDLLPTNLLDDELDFNLDLDEALLSRLSADLSNLEAMADQATQMLGSQEDFNLTLDDWTTEAPSSPAPEETSREASWQEVSLAEFAATVPEAEPELEPEPLSYAELSLEEFATALPEVPLSAGEAPLEALDTGLAEPELSLEEFATDLSEVTAPTSQPAPTELATVLDPSSSEEDEQGASLEEFASAIPEGAIADTEPSLAEFAAALSEVPLPESELSLETSATEVSQPALTPVSESPDERLDDLFAEPSGFDFGSSPTVGFESSPAFILEGMDDLFGDTVPASPAAPLVTPVVPDEPLPFTLEGMDSLFEDVPPVVAQPEPTIPTTTLSVKSEPLPPTDSPFTQENIENLFSRNKPAGSSTRPSTKPAQSGPAFTLEGMDDLFDDAPPVAPIVASPASDSVKPPGEAPPPSYVPTLERIDHLFEATTLKSPGMTSDPQADTLAGSIEDLFGDAPPVPATIAEPDPNPGAMASELLEDMDDWFGETTAPAPTESLSPTVEELTAFTLEGMDDLFVEPPTKSSSTGAESRSPRSNSPVAMDALTLDEAFESLLGSSPDASSTNPSTANPTTPEKKKKTR
ncbi:hypothetical protein [Pantanalinema sp. GBBB05]|uniref:hypothetical protein n=1 Tax=Pantanalinema sp. GBBB05 TaxID=2604139 RepID=UPI001D5BEBBF|nr:hypothetical protein [Pantanalinema sp. GBBB05]